MKNKLTKSQRNFYVRFDINLTITESSHMDSVVKEIYPKLKMINTNSRIGKELLKLVLLNLYQNYSTNKKLLTGFHKNVNKYKPKSRYNKNQISKKIIDIVGNDKEKTKDGLVKAGYIDYWNGYNSKNAWDESYTSRIRAKLKLINIIRRHKVEANQIEKHPTTECIVIQVSDGSSKIKLEYNDTPNIIKMRQDLTKYNNLLWRTHIDIGWIPEEGVIFGSSEYPVAITQKNKFMRRIFNDPKFETGGRYYGGWIQGLNSEWRNKITINLMPTVEVDFSANGINLLYAKERLTAPEGDQYDLSIGNFNRHLNPYPPATIYNGYSMKDLRPLLKLMMLIMINAKNYNEAYYAIKGDVNDSNKKLPQGAALKPLMAMFEQKHSAIKKYFYSGFGASLYKFDSTVAEGVINYFTNKDVPVLCIHDSFIIELEYLKELKAVMQDSFKKTMFAETAPNVNTDAFLDIYEPQNPEHKKSGLWSLIPHKIKENTLVRIFTPTSETIIKKEVDRTEANERYITFMDHQMRLERDYYYNNK